MSFVSIRIAGSGISGVDSETQAIVDQVRLRLESLSRERAGKVDFDNPLVASLPAEIENLDDLIVLRLPLLGFDLSDIYVLPTSESITIEARVIARRDVPEACVVEVAEKRLSHRYEFACEIHPHSVTATLWGSTLEVVARKVAHGAQELESLAADIHSRSSLAPSR